MFKLKQLLRAAADDNGGGDGAPGGGEVSLETLQAQIADLQAQNEAMKNKNSELLGETKKAKELRRQAEQQAQKEADEKARKAGDYEQLYKSSTEEKQRLEQQLEEIKLGTAKEKQKNTAMRIAGELAEGANAEILADYIAKRLKYTDDGIKVTDTNGDLTVSTLEQLKDEFSKSTRFASLLKGSQASGGSAPGGGKSTSGDKVMTRSEWDKQNAADKAKFVKSGGKVVD